MGFLKIVKAQLDKQRDYALITWQKGVRAEPITIENLF